MSTWGELALGLQEAFPGLSADQRVLYLNQAYARILDVRPWKGLTGRANLVTAAVYETGTVTLTNGSATVTGSGTTFTSGMVGRRFRNVEDSIDYEVATYVSATSITLDRVYEGDSDSGLSYEIYQNTYVVPLEVKAVKTIENPYLAWPLDKADTDEIDRAASGRFIRGEPRIWATVEDTPFTETPIQHQVRLWPIPEEAKAYPYTFDRAAPAFDGTNTSSAPLPWVSGSALLAKAKLDAASDLGDAVRAGLFAQTFEQEMDEMHAAENRRMGPQSLGADPFRSHYRALRGLR